MARQNRRDIFDPNEVGCFHAVQRTVRRAWFCGNALDRVVISPSPEGLKGRQNYRPALSGLGRILTIEPRALPWAFPVRPLGAADADELRATRRLVDTAWTH